MAAEDIRRYSSEELRQKIERGEYQETRADAPAVELDDAFWKQAESLGRQPAKVSVHLRLDPGTAEFFRRAGPGHLTRMANVLKAYAQSRR